MKELEILIRNRWVRKADNKELYYKIRDAAGEIRKFATEKMGCQLIENSLLVKLEKIPAVPESFMGIQDFTSGEEYAFLCMLLMFLEDKDAQEQFILSSLTEYIEAEYPGDAVDWTLYTHRRHLVKVLRFAVKEGIIRVTDGSDESFMDTSTGEVLYENTGASRYFMRNFSRDILDYSEPEDFEESDWFSMDEEKGIARRHRVYKGLIFSVGMYRDERSEGEFEYLKYYGRRLSEELEQLFDCQIHIYRGAAFMMLGEACDIGAVLPDNNVLSDIMLLVCGKIRENVQSGCWQPQKNDCISISSAAFRQFLKEIKARFNCCFTKNYREMPEGEFVREITKVMETWMLIRENPQSHEIVIYPACAKISGVYPKEYMSHSEGEEYNEQQMAGK